jgi:hypothetical protein
MFSLSRWSLFVSSRIYNLHLVGEQFSWQRLVVVVSFKDQHPHNSIRVWIASAGYRNNIQSVGWMQFCSIAQHMPQHSPAGVHCQC